MFVYICPQASKLVISRRINSVRLISNTFRKMKRGALIVVEGVDRSGKSSQTLKLVESLKQKNIHSERIAFPDRKTWTGQLISKYLSNNECKINDETIHLLFSANRWENVDKMKDLINNGVTLIVDRYSYSGMAFSVAKGMDIKWCMQPEIGLPKPDLVLLLTLDANSLKNRPGFGEERYETVTMQRTVSEVFKQFAVTNDNWKIVDASQSFDEVHEEMLNNIEAKIKDVHETHKPLGCLGCDNIKDENMQIVVNGRS